MSNYQNTKATIAANVYTNHNNEVTAEMVKTGINAVVDTLIAGGFLYKGVATTSTNPGSPDANVFYIASTPGTYTNFGSLVVADGEVAILKYNGSWSKEVTGAATAAEVSALGQEVGMNSLARLINNDEAVFELGTIVSTGAKSNASYRVRFAAPIPSRDMTIGVPDGYVIIRVVYYSSWTDENTFVLGDISAVLTASQVKLESTYPLVSLVIGKSDASNFTPEEFVNDLLNVGEKIDGLIDEMRGREYLPGDFPKIAGLVLYDSANGLQWGGGGGSSVIKVFKGQRITFTANNNYAINYALIESCKPVNNSYETGVDGDALKVVSKSATSTIVIPQDCYLYITLVDGSSNNREPSSVLLESIYDTINDKADGILFDLIGGEIEVLPVNTYAGWESGYIYAANGYQTASSVNSCTNYIEIPDCEYIRLVMSTTINVSDAGLCFYDSSKTFISGSGVWPNQTGTKGYQERIAKLPTGARYIRTSIYNEYTANFYLYAVNSSKYVKKEDVAVSNYGAEMLIGYPEIKLFDPVSESSQSLNTKSANDLYAEYDALATAHPEFLVRDADLGNVTYNGVTLAVRAYTLGYNKRMLIDYEPTQNEVLDNDDNLWQSSLNPRKILLVSGMHGEEKTPCWGMMLAIAELLESDEPWAQYIRSNFIFKIIPCLNPIGWTNNMRDDSQGHTINRDESINDPEVTYYMNWVSANNDAFIILDFHGTQGRYAFFPVLQKLPIVSLVEKLANKLASTFLSNWKAFYDSISPGYGTTYSPFLVAKYTTDWSYGRCLARIYMDYGIQGFAIETPDDLPVGDRHTNDLRNCKLTKDMFANVIQSVCQIPALPTE